MVKNNIKNSRLIIAGKGDHSEIKAIKDLSSKLGLDVQVYNEITENEKTHSSSKGQRICKLLQREKDGDYQLLRQINPARLQSHMMFQD